MSRRTLVSSVALGVISLIPALAQARPACLVGPRGADIFVRNNSGQRIGDLPSYTLVEAGPTIRRDTPVTVTLSTSILTGYVQSRFVTDARICESHGSPNGQPVEPDSDTPNTDPATPSTPSDRPSGNSPSVQPNLDNPADPFGCGNSEQCNRSALSRLASAGRQTLGYNGARERMFQYVDAMPNGQSEKVVQSVYSNDVLTVVGGGIPKDGFNTEHTWPQSFLKTYPAFDVTRADLYHLFPVEERINGARGNHPFTNCEGESSDQGRAPEQCGAGFEPPEQHKGQVARAMFYMSVAYNMPIDAKQESVLRDWNHEFPVTDEERARGQRIHEVQGNVNPFIEHPEWIEMICNF